MEVPDLDKLTAALARIPEGGLLALRYGPTYRDGVSGHMWFVHVTWRALHEAFAGGGGLQESVSGRRSIYTGGVEFSALPDEWRRPVVAHPVTL